MTFKPPGSPQGDEGKFSGEGKRILNPRSSITPFRRKDGTYLLLYSNTGRTDQMGYGTQTRLLTWIIMGRTTEDGQHIEWTQPELTLFYLDANPLGTAALDDRPGWNPDWAIVDGPG